MTSLLLTNEQPLKSRFLAELALSPNGMTAWGDFCRTVPAPTDLRLARLALQGARGSFSTSCAFLAEPNAKAQKLADLLQCIEGAMQQAQDQAFEEDAKYGLIRTLSSFPEWRLLAEAGNTDNNGTALQFVVGVELSVCLIEGHAMAHAFSIALRRDKDRLTVQPDLLLESLWDEEAPLRTPWANRFKKQLAVFSALFEGGQPRPIPKKKLNERFESQWATKAAFATHASRAAILDSRCLSPSQIELAIHHPRGERHDEYKAAMFFVGICGFSPSLVAEIPVQPNLLNAPVCYLAFFEGDCHLVRDFERLAHDQASPSGVDGQPASLVLSTPIPRDVSQHLHQRMRAAPNAQTLGNLIPLLAEIQSSEALYPSLEELEPTWAKLRPTMGRILRQHGLDSFLIALLTADFSLAARSKMYYATVSPKEMWEFAAVAYTTLGFEPPLPVHGHGIAFGSKVTPSTEQIRIAYLALAEEVERTRPSNKAQAEALLEFHGQYTYLLAFESMVLLALRESGHVPLPGRDDINVLYVVEKSSAGRAGGMAALIAAHLTQQMALYRAHCRALLTRLRGAESNPFIQWLRQVAHGDGGLDFCLCSPRGLAKPLATGQVLSAIEAKVRFSPDLGRKYLENELRLRHVNTEDIDRILRHDVLGQSATTGTSDGCEATWVRRIRPELDQIAKDLGFKLTRGLGGGAR